MRIAKILSVGIMLMGLVHVAATFTPLIADKLALLPAGAQGAFTYFSLMCGALLVLGGGITLSLADKVAEYPFVRWAIHLDYFCSDHCRNARRLLHAPRSLRMGDICADDGADGGKCNKISAE